MNPNTRTKQQQRLRNLYVRLSRIFAPSESQLQKLSQKDRAGLKITLPVIPISNLERGRTAFQEAQYSEALFHFSQALQENPHSAWAWHGKGDALQLLGDYKEALKSYEQAIQMSPQRLIHQAGKANALRGLGLENEYQQLRAKVLSSDSSLLWMLEK